MNKSKMNWRVNSPKLLHEISNNNGMSALRQPLNIFQSILKDLAKRAIELDDKELNKIMLRLSLYELSNPESKSFDQKAIDEYLNS